MFQFPEFAALGYEFAKSSRFIIAGFPHSEIHGHFKIFISIFSSWLNAVAARGSRRNFPRALRAAASIHATLYWIIDIFRFGYFFFLPKGFFFHLHSSLIIIILQYSIQFWDQPASKFLEDIQQRKRTHVWDCAIINERILLMPKYHCFNTEYYFNDILIIKTTPLLARCLIP